MSVQSYAIALLAGLAFAALALLGFVAVALTKRRSSASSLDELARRAGELLVEVDALLESSAEAAAAAEVEFGEDAAKPFREAVLRARTDAAQAFRQYMRLDNARPRSDRERSAVLADVLRRCERTSSELDACATRFERLRAGERKAPEVVPS